MNRKASELDKKLERFRAKFYVDKIIRGSLILLLLISSVLFVALLSEGLFGFSSSVRTGMVFTLVASIIVVAGYMVFWPISQLVKLSPRLSDFQIASLVRVYFPAIDDKLINVLQLRNAQSGAGTLTHAAISEKEAEMEPVAFDSAINLKFNLRYLRFLLIPILLFGLTYWINPSFIGSSSYRLMHYNEQFLPPPPFTILVSGLPDELVAGQGFDLQVEIQGNELPSDLFVYVRDDKEKGNQYVDFNLMQTGGASYEYSFTDVRSDFSFYVGNPQVSSDVYAVKVIRRPFIRQFQVRIQNPAYTGLGLEVLDPNIGDFQAIKGSKISWLLESEGELEEAWLVSGDSLHFGEPQQGKRKASLRLIENLDYFMALNSVEGISNLDTVKYKASVLQDRRPSIYMHHPRGDFRIDLDPTLPLDLEITDDFGFSKMLLKYKFVSRDEEVTRARQYKVYPLEIDPALRLQPLRYFIDLSSLNIQEGDEVEFFIEVWDNDAISGAKSASTAVFKILSPTLSDKYEQLGEQQEEVKEQITDIKETSERLKEAYEKLQEKLLDKKNLSFDDKKELQEMLEEHEQMMEQLREAQKAMEENKDQLQENQMLSQETLEKYEELSKFMEELENPEIQKLLDEIQSKMEELNSEEMKEMLSELQLKDEEVLKSLERTLELLKQLEVQQKIDELRNKLDNMKAREDVLNEQLERAEDPEELSELGEKQEKLEEEMKNFAEDLEELSEMKSGTQTPDEETMEQLKEDAEEVSEKMDEAASEMENSAEKKEEGGKQNKKQSQQAKQKASEQQKSASEQMQKMSESLSNMQMEMGQAQDQENLDDLRELLENLLKLSFDQEDLRDEVRALGYGDPALVDRSQDQKKLRDDMQLVGDSLDALANRVFQIRKFVLDESAAIKEDMDESQTFFRNMQISKITLHQHGSMTHINNLANMLSDVMQQVQEQMMQAQSGQQACPKPGDQNSMQNMSKQQQQLNQQMQQMMKSGQMDGKKLSEMAARQEAIRKELEQYRQSQQESGKKSLGDLGKIAGDMKETEADLMNKRLTHETMLRQQQIMNRLLQADRSMREQDLDRKRESTTGLAEKRISPGELTEEEYQQVLRQEMLKTRKLEYSGDFLILIERYYKMLEGTNEHNN